MAFHNSLGQQQPLTLQYQFEHRYQKGEAISALIHVLNILVISELSATSRNIGFGWSAYI